MVDSGLELSVVDSQQTEKSLQYTDVDSRLFVPRVANEAEGSWIASGARLKLQEKHAHHVADLQAYYDGKLSEVQRQLQLACVEEAKLCESTESSDATAVVKETVAILRRSRQQYDDLKIAHSTLQRQTADLERSLVTLKEQLASVCRDVDRARADALVSASQLAEEQERAAQLQGLVEEEKNARQLAEETHQQELAALSEQLHFEEEQRVRLQQQLHQAEAETARMQAELQLVSSAKHGEEAHMKEELERLKSSYLQAMERSRLDQRLIARLLPQYEQVCDDLEARKKEDGALASRLEHCERQLAATQADYEVEKKDKENLERQVADLQRQLLALRSWKNKAVNESSCVLAGSDLRHSFLEPGLRQPIQGSGEALPTSGDNAVLRESSIPAQHLHQRQFLSPVSADIGSSSSSSTASPRSNSIEQPAESPSKLHGQGRETVRSSSLENHLTFGGRSRRDSSELQRSQPAARLLSGQGEGSTHPTAESDQVSPFFRASGAGQRMVSLENPLAQQMTGIRGSTVKGISSHGEDSFNNTSILSGQSQVHPATPPISNYSSRRQESNHASPLIVTGTSSADRNARNHRSILIHGDRFAEDCAELGLRPVGPLNSNQLPSSNSALPNLEPRRDSLPLHSRGSASIFGGLHQSSQTALSALRHGALVAYGDPERDCHPPAQTGYPALPQQQQTASVEERVRHRLALVENTEKHLIDLTRERDELEASLCRQPRHAKVVLADKKLRAEKEQRLEQLSREIASTRLSLRNLNVLRQ